MHQIEGSDVRLKEKQKKNDGKSKKKKKKKGLGEPERTKTGGGVRDLQMIDGAKKTISCFI